MHSVSKIVLIFHCLNKMYFSITWTLVGQNNFNNFQNKMPNIYFLSKIESMGYISWNYRAIAKQRGFDPAVYKYLPNLVANQKPSPVPTTVKWLYNIVFTISWKLSMCCLRCFSNTEHTISICIMMGGLGMFSAKLVHSFAEFQYRIVSHFEAAASK